MRSLRIPSILLGLVLLPAVAVADPIPGIYNSTDLGGSLLIGRSSTSRKMSVNQ